MATRDRLMDKGHSIVCSKEMGVVAIVTPHETKVRGAALLLMAQVLHYLNEISYTSTFLKLKQTQRSFGSLVSSSMENHEQLVSVLAGAQISWRMIQRFYGRSGGADHPEIFEPQVHPEDIIWRSAQDELALMIPNLDYWADLDYAGRLAHDQRPVSFNLMDLCHDLMRGNAYQARTYRYIRESLWDEVYARYMGLRYIEDQVVSRIG